MTPPNLKVSETLKNNHAEKRAIPKFASFRPKKVHTAEGADNSSDWQRDRPTPKLPVRGPEDHVYSSSKRHSQRQDDHRAKEDDAPRKSTISSRSIYKQVGERPQSYVIDRVGDSQNLTFGALHRHTTPLYNRRGAGTVLGCPLAQRISRSVNNEKTLVLEINDNRQGKSGDRQALWKAAHTRTKKLKIKPKPNVIASIDLEADFVSLGCSQQTKRKRDTDSLNVGSSPNSDAEDEHYRSIDGMAKTKRRPEEESLTYDEYSSSSSSERDGHAFAVGDSVLNNRSAISKKIDEDRKNCDAWLDLLLYQDNVLGLDSMSKRGSFTSAERRSNAEIKISICDKALENVRDPSGRERLLLGRMREAAQIWDNERLSSEWQSILHHNSAYLTLWNEYLNYTQTAFVSFRYERVRESYYNCLNMLKTLNGIPGVSDADVQKLHVIRKYVLVRLTILMRESGFTEQSVAAWQALLEYNFFRPLDLRASEYNEGGSLHTATASRFEHFWDSEVPRLGEVGCEGWSTFDQGIGIPPEPRTDAANDSKNVQDVWESWVISEHSCNLLAREPARTVDDVAENDPYRVILFSDVRPFLIDSPSVFTQIDCLNAFLAFCHLPPYGNNSSDSESRSLWADGYLHNEALSWSRQVSQSIMNERSVEEVPVFEGDATSEIQPDSKSSRRDVFDLPISEYRLSSDTLFAKAGSWFSAFDAWSSRNSNNRGPLETAWVLRTLKYLVASSVGGDSLAEYVLALELRLSPETAQKSAKSLLKKRPSSLLLYNAYALIEYRLGNAGKADKALLTSITLCNTFDEAARKESLLLWRTWTWEVLMAGDTRRALKLLLMYGDESIQADSLPGNSSDIQSAQAILLLRAESNLTSTRDHLLSRGQYKYAAFAIDCLLILNYLKTASSLAAATSVFQINCVQLTTYMSSRDPILEYLHQSFARLLYFHVTHTNLTKPNDVRSLLAESIALFPNNTIFLSLYAWNERRFRINDRVRSIVNNVVLAGGHHGQGSQGDESIVAHFFAIYSEFNRGVTFGSNASAIRSTFERAVESRPGAHCAGLWKLYFVFEHSRNNMEKAKGVFWRAVRACPWVKELYLLAFDYLRGTGGLGQDELRGVYDLMGEKELRIHVDLDDVSDALEDADDTALPGS